MEVNLHLKELSKEKNIFLIDNSRKIKAQHLNKGKLCLTKYISRILSNNFVNEISKVIHWKIDRGNSNVNAQKCNFKDDDLTLKTICSDNVNKLVFAHKSINSIRNKFEFLAMQVKGKIDILMISETKIDESFPKGNFLIRSDFMPGSRALET